MIDSMINIFKSEKVKKKEAGQRALKTRVCKAEGSRDLWYSVAGKRLKEIRELNGRIIKLSEENKFLKETILAKYKTNNN